MAAVPVALAVLTLVILLDPRVAPGAINLRLSLALDLTASLVAAAVAILAWAHFREGGDPAALLRGSAFVALGTLNALFALSTSLGMEATFGLSPDDPGQLPVWATGASRSVAATLLVLAGLAAVRGTVRLRWPPAGVFWLPGLAVLAFAVLAALGDWPLPTLIPTEQVSRLANDPRLPLEPAAVPVYLAWQVLIALGYLAAALLSYRVYRRDGRSTEAILSIGLILAAFSQVHFAVHPGTYASLVSTGDVLRVAFDAVLLVHIAAESREDVRALRAANAEVLRLRDAEVERALGEERARLAREIHDGMSQELWYARLKQSRLAAIPDLPAAAAELAREVETAVEHALSEARQAIAALRPSDGATFAQALDRYLGDYADRFGIPAESSADPAAERLPARVQAELLRIVQEALTNARRHADPTLVRVQVTAAGGALRLLVSDNGRGFDPSTPARSGYGLLGMRERAELIGARLTIDSGPGDGTRVIVDLPLEGTHER
jgi:signal transduction histidine kinase